MSNNPYEHFGVGTGEKEVPNQRSSEPSKRVRVPTQAWEVLDGDGIFELTNLNLC